MEYAVSGLFNNKKKKKEERKNNVYIDHRSNEVLILVDKTNKLNLPE